MYEMRPFPDLRLIHAAGCELKALRKQLAAVSAARPTDWLDDCARDPDSFVVVAAIHRLIVGYVSVHAADGVITVGHACVASSQSGHHPEILAAMVEAAVESAQLPWGSIRVQADSPALAHLVRIGWYPLSMDGPCRPFKTLTLSGAALN